MVLQGETLVTGAPEICPDCEQKVTVAVMISMAGHYVGSYCNCGPYSRESVYYDKREDAEKALEFGHFGRD